MITAQVDVFIAPEDDNDLSVEFGGTSTRLRLGSAASVHWIGADQRHRAVEMLRHAAYLIEQGEAR